MCSLQCILHRVIKEEQTRVVPDSRITQQKRRHGTLKTTSDAIKQADKNSNKTVLIKWLIEHYIVNHEF